MQQSFVALETALRVLTSINEKRLPDPADVVALRSYVGPEPEGIGLDEFACMVIQKAINNRAEARTAARGVT